MMTCNSDNYYQCIICYFQGGTVVKNPPANAGYARDAGLIPGSGRPPGVGNGNPLQFSCLENSTDKGAWWAAVHEVAKSCAKRACTHTHTQNHEKLVTNIMEKH